jgi:hypothetical protein
MNVREQYLVERCIADLKSDDVQRAIETLRNLCRGESRVRTPIRSRRAAPRKGPMRDANYRAFCRTKNCARCGRVPTSRFPSDPAHTRNNGMSSKGPDSSCAPLCRPCHSEYDAGRKAFEVKTNLNMAAVAAQHYAEYLKEKRKAA